MNYIDGDGLELSPTIGNDSSNPSLIDQMYGTIRDRRIRERRRRGRQQLDPCLKSGRGYDCIERERKDNSPGIGIRGCAPNQVGAG